MDTRFLKSLKIYSINSLMLHTNDVIALIAYFSVNNKIWMINSTQYTTSYSFIFYYTYILLPLWTILYSFGSGSMDIFILYGRIQMLVPRLKFLSKVSLYKVAVFLAFFSCVINLPINMSRQAFKSELKIDSNSTTVLYSYGKIFYK